MRIQSWSGAAQNAGSASLTVTSMSAVSAGNKIHVFVSVDSSTQTINSVQDQNANNWTLLKTATNTSQVTVAWYFLDVPAGDVGSTLSITVTAANTNASIAILCIEESGELAGNTTAAADGTPGNTGADNNTPTAPSYSSAASGEDGFVVIGDWGGGFTFTAPSGLTADANSINGSGTGNILVAPFTTTGGAESHTFTVAGATSWVQFVGAMKSGTPPTPVGYWSGS